MYIFGGKYMNLFRKIISVVLLLSILVSTLVLIPTAQAKKSKSVNKEANISANNVFFNGNNNSIATMTSDALNEKISDEIEDNFDNTILDISFKDNIATVSFNNNQVCKIIVGIYDEAYNSMVASGIVEVKNINQNKINVKINTTSMPKYFLVNAFMLDSNNKPISNKYESKEYTKDFKEFMSKTVDDFKDDEVANFDSDKKNNFAVFKNSSKKLSVDSKNKLISKNDKENTYTFSNINDEIKNLKTNDIFYFLNNNEYVIVKVNSIKINGSKATVIGKKTDLKEVFSYVKINTVTTSDDAKISNVNKNEGVTYDGEVRSKKNVISVGSDPDAEVKIGVSKEFSISGEFLSAKIGTSCALSFKIYLNLNDLQIHFSFANSNTFKIDVSKKFEKETKIGSIIFPTAVPGLAISVDINFVVGAEGKLSISFTQENSIGFALQDGKLINVSKPSKSSLKLDIATKIYAGLKLSPSISILGDLVKISVNGTAKAVIVVKEDTTKDTENEKHLCKSCKKGSMNGELEFGVSINFEVCGFKASDEYKFLKVSIKLLDFYLSSDIGFGFGTCPNHLVKLMVVVINENNKPINNTKININSLDNSSKNIIKTNSKGVATEFLKRGDYSVFVKNNSKCRSSYKLIHLNKYMGITINLYSNSFNDFVYTNVKLDKQKGYKCGKNSYFYLDKNGTMNIYGSGELFNNIYSMPVGLLPVWCETKKIIINDGITSIGESDFAICGSVMEIVIPNSVEKIDSFAFHGCTKIKSITLPNKLHSISDYLFLSCKSLNKVYIPKSVKSIGIKSFSECNNLKILNYEGNITDWNKINLGGNNNSIIKQNIEVKCADGVINYSSNQLKRLTKTKNRMTSTGGGNDSSMKLRSFISKSGLSPNQDYILLSLKGNKETCQLNEKSLLYINQVKADENGNVKFEFFADTLDDVVNIILGQCTHSKIKWVTVNEPIKNIATIKVKKCAICDEELDTQVFPLVLLNKIILNKGQVNLDNGSSAFVKVTVTPTNTTNKKLKWTTSNSKVAVVNSQGKITAKGKGTATIKVMALDGSNKYATMKVTVKQPVTSVKLNKKLVTLKVKGNSKQKIVTLKATVNPKNANNKAVSWKSSNSRIVTVNSKGKVTAKKKGTCYITATAKDGSKKSAKCKVVVK